MISDDPTSGRQGRPKSEEKRLNISQAAAHLFLDQGFERTSMDNIAHSAGVSKQTVYSHFQNKDDLFRSCITGKITKYQLAVDASQHKTLESGLSAVADGFLNLLSDQGVLSMWRLVINEALAHPRVAKLFYEAGPDATYNYLATFLQQNADKLSTTDYKRAAMAFLSNVKGPYEMPLMLGLITEIPDAERKQHIKTVIEQFMTLFSSNR